MLCTSNDVRAAQVFEPRKRDAARLWLSNGHRQLRSSRKQSRELGTRPNRQIEWTGREQREPGGRGGRRDRERTTENLDHEHMAVISILLAEDHRIVREGLRAVLAAEADFKVVGETGDGIEAVRLTEQLVPKILVTDLVMPGLSGLEVARQIRQRGLPTQVIILSMHAKEAYILEALQNGAAGYVLKESSAAELVRAVREVAAGRRYLSPPLSEPAIEAYLQRAQATGSPDPYSSLTSREREVLHLAAEGHTSAEIARRLFISTRTVETHRANVLHKLGLRSHADMIRYALQRGILPMDDNSSPQLPPQKV
jgi:two-component system, NarL family, response regulator NreC